MAPDPLRDKAQLLHTSYKFPQEPACPLQGEASPLPSALCSVCTARGTHHEVPRIQASACILNSPRDALPSLFFSWKISPGLENLARPSLLSGIFLLVSKTVHHFLPGALAPSPAL